MDFSRSKILNNIPSKKLQMELDIINKSNDTLEIKNLKLTAINRYAETNIPVEYWKISMEKDFVGDNRLKEKYDIYIGDIKLAYETGKSICFAGNNGNGKTLTATSILKKVVQKGYSGLYTEFPNMISALTQADEDRFTAKKELMMVDFLVLDEIDPRFVASDKSADFYARNLESIFRTRCANKLPTLMATNSPNIIEMFNGSLKISIDSLFKGYLEIMLVLGKDFRKDK